MPGKKVCMNLLRSALSMGWRFVRNCSSINEGGGILSSIHKKTSIGTRNTPQAAKGIHVSDTPQSRIRYAPTERHRPAEKIKLTDKDAPSASVMRLPSRKPNTMPQTSPSGKPFINKKIRL